MNFQFAKPPIQTEKISPILIFSHLKIRKKTAATLSGVVIALGSLWGLAMWQDISRAEILRMLLATVTMVAVIAVCAMLLIVVFKLGTRLLHKLLSRNTDNDD